MMLKNAIVTHIRSVACYVALVSELARRASGGNDLSLLVPSVVSFLPLSNTSSVRFVHGLIERGVLGVNEIVKRVLNCEFNYFAFFYFAPEIEAFNPSLFGRRLREIEAANWQFRDCFRHLDDLLKDDWTLHKELRSLDKHPWILAQYIDQDDVDGAQAFVTMNFLDVNQAVPVSPFQLREFLGVPHNPSLLEYSALFGSLRCFKYFLMAGAKLTGSVGYCAIAGKNSEIIRLCEQRDCLRWDMTLLLLAIQCHKFSAFMWMVETHDIEFREIEILEAALEAANFEVFAYHMLRCKGVDLIMNHLTFVLFSRRSC
jgi:hypothetical protein